MNNVIQTYILLDEGTQSFAWSGVVAATKHKIDIQADTIHLSPIHRAHDCRLVLPRLTLEGEIHRHSALNIAGSLSRIL